MITRLLPGTCVREALSFCDMCIPTCDDLVSFITLPLLSTLALCVSVESSVTSSSPSTVAALSTMQLVVTSLDGGLLAAMKAALTEVCEDWEVVER